MQGIKPADSKGLIESEKRRLQELERNQKIKDNHWSDFVMRHDAVMFEDFVDAMMKATSFSDFPKRLKMQKGADRRVGHILETLLRHEGARRDFNEVRTLLGVKPLRLRRSELGPRDEQATEKPTALEKNPAETSSKEQ
jgi:hypothetical protein